MVGGIAEYIKGKWISILDAPNLPEALILTQMC